jgi:ABC-type transport system involved in cytochrome c biogenesis permease subunit
VAVVDSASPVAHESSVRTRQAVIAAVAGICLLGAAVVQALGPQAKVSELTVELIATNKRAALEIAGAVINAIGLLGLAATLVFLFGASRARRPESASATRITALVGGILAAVGGIAYGIMISVKSHEFATQGTQTYLQANKLVSTVSVAGLQYAGLIGSLLLAIAFVLVAMNAMRVGLLTKFLGYLGMVAAAASLFLIGSAPALLVEVFWLMAVAYLFAGRWPGGDPPSWRTGVAEPWPTAAKTRDQRQRPTGKGGRAQARPAARGPQTASPPPQSTRSTTPKRKRKRRK